MLVEMLEYRGFKIKKDTDLSNGAEGKWIVPELLHYSPGGIKKGFYTVSKLQATEAIDSNIEYNEDLRMRFNIEKAFSKKDEVFV